MAGPKKIASTVIHTGDRLQSDMQARTRANTQAINGIPFLRGRLVSVKFAGAASVVIAHKLGTPARCFPVSLEHVSATFLQVRESGDQTGIDRDNQLRIISNGAGTMDLWFYPQASKLIPNGEIQG